MTPDDLSPNDSRAVDHDAGERAAIEGKPLPGPSYAFDGETRPQVRPPTKEELGEDAPAPGRKRGRGRAVLHVASAEDDPRPAIRMSVELHEVIDRGVAALGADPDLYQRDSALVRIARVSDEEALGDPLATRDTPQIRAVTAPTLRERLTRVARWEHFDRRRNRWAPAVPSDNVVQAVLHRGAWPSVRPIVGVIEAPALRPDGSVITVEGYDRTTGFLYLPGVAFPEVPAAPSQADARRALDVLEGVFCDFPHARPEHRSAVVAAILTLVARPAIRGAVPGFLFDASTRGSGKTLQADAVAIVGTGRATAKMNYPSDDAELEKVLGSYALRAPALVNFDNITRPFGGGPLDRVLTAEDTVELRILGRSEIPTLRWRSVIVATGNNIVLQGDTARRVLVSRLESPLENPEDRAEFKHPELLEWVRAERPRLVCAALTILRAFVAAGRPPQEKCKPWGSFGPWSALVPPALVYAGGTDPMQARPTVAGEEEPEKLALGIVLRDWPRLDARGEGLTARDAIAFLYPAERRGREAAAAAPDGFDDLREAIEAIVPTKPGAVPNVPSLGNKLRAYVGRVVGDRKLSSVSGRGGIRRWRVAGAREAAPPRSCPTEACSCGGCPRCRRCKLTTPGEGGCSC